MWFNYDKLKNVVISHSFCDVNIKLILYCYDVVPVVLFITKCLMTLLQPHCVLPPSTIMSSFSNRDSTFPSPQAILWSTLLTSFATIMYCILTILPMSLSAKPSISISFGPTVSQQSLGTNFCAGCCGNTTFQPTWQQHCLPWDSSPLFGPFISCQIYTFLTHQILTSTSSFFPPLLNIFAACTSSRPHPTSLLNLTRTLSNALFAHLISPKTIYQYLNEQPTLQKSFLASCPHQ